MSNLGVCPMCMKHTLESVVTSYEHEYKGHTLVIEDFVMRTCSSCGAEIEYPEDNLDAERRILDLKRDVDGLLRPSEIRRIRKSFGLTQKDFAEILGVGAKSFARYETGAVVQGRSMDTMLRLLKAHGSLDVLPQVRKPAGEILSVVVSATAGQRVVGLSAYPKVERATSAVAHLELVCR